MTEKDFENAGWQINQKWSFPISNTYAKGNFWLTHYTSYGYILIQTIDPCEIEWTPYPENFKIMIPCDSIDFVKLLEIQLGI